MLDVRFGTFLYIPQHELKHFRPLPEAHHWTIVEGSGGDVLTSETSRSDSLVVNRKTKLSDQTSVVVMILKNTSAGALVN